MKNNTSEPPGRAPNRQTGGISFPRNSLVQPPASSYQEVPPAVRSYRSIDEMVHELRPDLPVYCLRPATIAATAKRFLKAFPGDVFYAVKTNPDPLVLKTLARAGVTHFDVASLAEVRLVAEHAPMAEMHFMHPVKSREAIAAAYHEHGVRDFALDTQEELAKIMEATDGASDLNLFVRLSIPNDKAAYSLSGKFGVSVDQALPLLKSTREAANRLGVCFHVGSQCMNPEAYVVAIDLVAGLLAEGEVRLDILDIGGGFPSLYPGLTPPPLAQYMKAINKAVASHHVLDDCRLVCEPGRALVAEGGSTVARVELRKGNALYLNEGVFGSLFDAGVPGFVFPVKAIRPEPAKGALAQELAEFTFFGPTCDSMDAMKGPFHLPANVAEGDWIEVGQLGSYGATMATRFNGFQSDVVVEVGDKPLLSRLGVN